jgi:protein-L-isoaspartate O-methyltransferase
MWESRARALAETIVYPQSRWQDAVVSTPRHLLVPRWFERGQETNRWELRDGPSDQGAWLDAAYGAGQTLVTRVGPVHADQAEPGTSCQGWPTSSSTLPYLVIAMYRHARIYDGADVLDVGTGPGYGCALLTRRLGAEHVTSIDVDPYLTSTATARLADCGLHPQILTCDASTELPGNYDRIVPMLSMSAIPPSWLTALRTGGRLVFSLAASGVVITATKTADGGATGQVESKPAWFMADRQGDDYPPRQAGAFEAIRDRDGEQVTRGRYPAIAVTWDSDLDAMLSVTAPGIMNDYEHDQQTGITTAWMLHEDGSWARAGGREDEPPLVHQGGPRRLWDILDDIRHHWITHGTLPLRGADAHIDPDGTCYLSQGDWHATIGPLEPTALAI